MALTNLGFTSLLLGLRAAIAQAAASPAEIPAQLDRAREQAIAASLAKG